MTTPSGMVAAPLAVLEAGQPLPGNDYYSNQQLASGELTISRVSVGAGPALTSGTMALAYFTAQKTEVCNNLIAITQATASAGLTYAAMGVYAVAANGNLTLVASTADVHTTAFTATFTTYTVPLQASFTKQAGQRYALGVLLTGTTMQNIVGTNGTTVLNTNPPRLTGQVSGQVALPASVASGSVSGFGSMYMIGVTP